MTAPRADRRTGRLGVGVVGAGRVGPVLAAALGGAGHALTGIAGVDDSRRERVQSLLPGVPELDIPTVLERSELVLLAVPADALPGLVEGLAAGGHWQGGQLVVHTAPSLGTGVLAPAARAGGIPVALGPAMVFTGTSLDLARLQGSWCAVTAPAAVQPIGQALVVEMGAEPVLVDDADRPDWGEALATATTFSQAITAQALGLLSRIGVPDPHRVIAPVLHSAVDSALSAGSAGDIPPEPPR